MECALLNDKRRIVTLYWPKKEGLDLAVGKEGVTSIVVVPVTGEGAYVPWFEVVRNGRTSRWNAAHVEGVEYEKDEPPANES